MRSGSVPGHAGTPPTNFDAPWTAERPAPDNAPGNEGEWVLSPETLRWVRADEAQARRSSAEGEPQVEPQVYPVVPYGPPPALSQSVLGQMKTWTVDQFEMRAERWGSSDLDEVLDNISGMVKESELADRERLTDAGERLREALDPLLSDEQECLAALGRSISSYVIHYSRDLASLESGLHILSEEHSSAARHAAFALEAVRIGMDAAARKPAHEVAQQFIGFVKDASRNGDKLDRARDALLAAAFFMQCSAVKHVLSDEMRAKVDSSADKLRALITERSSADGSFLGLSNEQQQSLQAEFDGLLGGKF